MEEAKRRRRRRHEIEGFVKVDEDIRRVAHRMVGVSIFGVCINPTLLWHNTRRESSSYRAEEMSLSMIN